MMQPHRRRRRLWLLAAIAAVALLSCSWGSHAGVTRPVRDVVVDADGDPMLDGDGGDDEWATALDSEVDNEQQVAADARHSSNRPKAPELPQGFTLTGPAVVLETNRDDHLPGLLQWAELNGVDLSRLELVRDRYGGWGVQAAVDMGVNETILEVPEHLAISKNCIEFERELARLVPTMAQLDASQQVVDVSTVVVCLVHAAFYQGNPLAAELGATRAAASPPSPWAPYLASLPHSQPGMPNQWPKPIGGQLAGLALGVPGNVERMNKELQAIVDVACAALVASPQLFGKHTDELEQQWLTQVMWATLMVKTRAVPDLQEEPVLIPFVDMLNTGAAYNAVCDFPEPPLPREMEDGAVMEPPELLEGAEADMVEGTSVTEPAESASGAGQEATAGGHTEQAAITGGDEPPAAEESRIVLRADESMTAGDPVLLNYVVVPDLCNGELLVAYGLVIESKELDCVHFDMTLRLRGQDVAVRGAQDALFRALVPSIELGDLFDEDNHLMNSTVHLKRSVYLVHDSLAELMSMMRIASMTESDFAQTQVTGKLKRGFLSAVNERDACTLVLNEVDKARKQITEAVQAGREEGFLPAEPKDYKYEHMLITRVAQGQLDVLNEHYTRLESTCVRKLKSKAGHA